MTFVLSEYDESKRKSPEQIRNSYNRINLKRRITDPEEIEQIRNGDLKRKFQCTLTREILKKK